jgi:hypothetical protein
MGFPQRTSSAAKERVKNTNERGMRAFHFCPLIRTCPPLTCSGCSGLRSWHRAANSQGHPAGKFTHRRPASYSRSHPAGILGAGGCVRKLTRRVSWRTAGCIRGLARRASWDTGGSIRAVPRRVSWRTAACIRGLARRVSWRTAACIRGLARRVSWRTAACIRRLPGG